MLTFAIIQANCTRIASANEDAVNFVRDIQPIFRDHCFECHSTGNMESGLNLGLRDAALAGGDSGPILKAGKRNDSRLFRLIASDKADERMPPEGDPLSAEEIERIGRWIDQGADWPKGVDVHDAKLDRAQRHWAFQPLGADFADATTIDGITGAALVKAGLERAPRAAPHVLARRLHFDLTGLPPTVDELTAFVQRFEADPDAAVKNRVDRLLATRQYGERWARHWLDIARYADSDGQEADRDRPDAFRFRDFVIRALNDDLPIRTFLQWQIAGDELQPKNSDAIIATGFLTAGPHTVLQDSFLEEERLRNRYNELDDVVSTFGSAMLGVTIGCARCHDHKFDAVTARDYYQLTAAFHSGDRKVGKLPNGEQALFFQDFGAKAKKSWLFRRADFYDREIEVAFNVPGILNSKDAPAWWEQAKADYSGSVTGSTRQRAALATWLTDVEHGAGALVARVFVNRVWQHHFGVGLVATSGDFGVRGEAPTHPELLEWLTRDFVEHGWKLKRLHRMILLSRTWQQGAGEKASRDRDPQNRLLSRRTPQRLEAEALRDAVLFASGQLNEKPYGPGFKPFIPKEAILARNLKDGGYPANAKDGPETRRRSIYMFHKRVVPYPLFQAFDRPDLLQSCSRRQNTTVAPQALALLNDPFIRSCAEDFANDLLAEQKQEQPPLAQVVSSAFVRCFSRAPAANESKFAVAFIEQQIASHGKEPQAKTKAVADFCQVLFGLNEFIYVD